MVGNGVFNFELLVFKLGLVVASGIREGMGVGKVVIGTEVGIVSMNSVGCAVICTFVPKEDVLIATSVIDCEAVGAICFISFDMDV